MIISFLIRFIINKLNGEKGDDLDNLFMEKNENLILREGKARLEREDQVVKFRIRPDISLDQLI
jgi:hypothetical protein